MNDDGAVEPRLTRMRYFGTLSRRSRHTLLSFLIPFSFFFFTGTAVARVSVVPPTPHGQTREMQVPCYWATLQLWALSGVVCLMTLLWGSAFWTVRPRAWRLKLGIDAIPDRVNGPLFRGLSGRLSALKLLKRLLLFSVWMHRQSPRLGGMHTCTSIPHFMLPELTAFPGDWAGVLLSRGRLVFEKRLRDADACFCRFASVICPTIPRP